MAPARRRAPHLLPVPMGLVAIGPVALLLVGCSSGSPAAIDGGPRPGADASTAPEDLAGRACRPVEVAGDFPPFLASVVSVMMDKAGAGSEAFQVPDAAAQAAFSSAVVAGLAGRRAGAACQLPASYRWVHLVDGRAGGIVAAVEVDDRGAPAPALFWGTFAALESPASPPSRPLLIEAPHPLFDANTWRQAGDLFVQGRAAALLVAGAHRCANAAHSGCDGSTTACGGASGPFHVSDTAHSVRTPLASVHQALMAQIPSLTALQLHGNSEACPTALLSSGVAPWSDSGATAMLGAALARAGVAVGKCGAGYPTASCDLCGYDNVEARATAGSPDACTRVGSTYGRVVHLEQQASLRATPAGGAPGYQVLIDAVLATFTAR